MEYKMLEVLLKGLEYRILGCDGEELAADKSGEAVRNTRVFSITNDSRKASEGALFFCIKGANSDGHDYAQTAASQGASVLVTEHPVKIEAAEGAPVIVCVPSTRYAMALISAAWYEHPAERMKMIGITGTKGKTTTTYLIRSILEHAGVRMGLIGTIESLYTVDDPEAEGGRRLVRVPANNTTPESIVLQRVLKEMADAGTEAVVMEVSSQALMMDRTAGILYDIGLFTNLSPDHIGPNEHSSFEEYLHCKSLLFQQSKVGIFNGDDPHVQQILEGHTCEVETFGLGTGNDLYADDLQLIHVPGKLGIAFDTEGLIHISAQVPTPGKFSVYNALAAIAVCRHFKVEPPVIVSALASAHVKGRIEMVDVSDDFTLMIDYAHNAVALESLLTTLREYDPGRLVTVFGCGGNRSRSRRFEMGEVSGNLSDLTIITSDNPRFEEPMDIIADIVTGIEKTSGKYVTIPDRKDAIRYAIRNGQPGDIIVLAGKGHEDYQEIKGVKHPMDERVLISEILAE